jgi:endonuclease/exonuclease/phosphatase family metal-dependent hydrolase
MPEITDKPEKDIKQELAELRASLDKIPSKAVDNNLLIATWNIRAFGDLTKKWRSSSNDSPKRDLHALLCIGEILSKFDVIAIQELKSNIKAFRHLLKWLGSDWQFLLTDETKGYRGNGERLAFLFDTRKVRLSGLACELVIPEDPKKPRNHALDRQFARTPYAVGFQSGKKTFILVTFHVLYGDSASDRIPELKEIALWLKEWALNVNAWNHNLIALGDFNTDRKDDNLYKAFTSTGLQPPQELDDAPRTIFSKPNEPDTHKFYDQIAWFNGIDNEPALSMSYKSAGYFDFLPHVLKNRKLSKRSLSWHISDHYPLWVEFDTRELP